jgi:hypothetical protein
MTAYRYENRGRSRRAAVVLALVWGVLLALVWWIALAPWIALVLVLFTLPAAYEFVTDPRSWLCLDDSALAWHSARSEDCVPLEYLLRVRLDTRLDLSVRVTLLLKDGRRVRLPHACTPPHQRLEAELKARGISVERQHFSLIG